MLATDSASSSGTSGLDEVILRWDMLGESTISGLRAPLGTSSGPVSLLSRKDEPVGDAFNASARGEVGKPIFEAAGVEAGHTCSPSLTNETLAPQSEHLTSGIPSSSTSS